MTDTQNKDDEKFNDTLKRMLKTPPDHKVKDDGRSRRPRLSHEDSKDSGDTE